MSTPEPSSAPPPPAAESRLDFGLTAFDWSNVPVRLSPAAADSGSLREVEPLPATSANPPPGQG